jgi:hypothetical protein
MGIQEGYHAPYPSRYLARSPEDFLDNQRHPHLHWSVRREAL